MTLTFGSLFAGIGGFDLGFERAGMACKWQVEIDDYATRVLERHWPNVKRHRDIRDCGSHNLDRVDVICGGFPCQDISNAGKKSGIHGSRSSMFFELIRVVREVRPERVVLENTAGLLDRGLGEVLGALAECGFDAEWGVLSSAGVGANHLRRRVFVHAYANERLRQWIEKDRDEMGRSWRVWSTEDATKAHVVGRHQTFQESQVLRVANGISRQLDRNRCLGNSVDPRLTQWIGERIVESELRQRY